MLKVKLLLTNIEFDSGNYFKKLTSFYNTQFHIAARAWLKEVIIRVPVFAGTARGTFLPLAKYLNVTIPITPVAIRKSWGPEIGAEYSAFKFDIQEQISTFEFNEELFYYETNELGDPRPKGIHLTHTPIPWQSFNAGKIAFRKSLKDAIKTKMPRIEKYLLRGTLTKG